MDRRQPGTLPSTRLGPVPPGPRDDLEPVVLIGGAPGTGKSTLAGDLSAHLQFDHRIGTGFIRAVLQSEATPGAEPALFSLTFQAEDPIAHLELQARRLRGAVTACVRRARHEGTSLIVEGAHLVPALYAGTGVDLFVVLAAPPPDAHLARLHGLTHRYRRITEPDWRNIQAIDAYYREQAGRHGIPLLVYHELEPVLALLGEFAGHLRQVRTAR